ncbi:16S rRNA methyltransferase [Candidatus Bathyarchaeota archaeon]|nr:16S rRNA methyltransferase [Candidatus Bathyarchaeota archaeon]
MLNLIIAETALELVPKKIQKHPAVTKHAQRMDKKPCQLLLDRSYHHSAMKNLDKAKKRGRPDIAHKSLLAALGTPLNKEGLLHVYIHTIDNRTIRIDSKTRLPRNYNQFVGLIEQLYIEGKVPKEKTPLLSIETKDITSLIRELETTYVVALTKTGEPRTLEEVAQILTQHDNATVIIGGFPHGHFNKEINKMAKHLVSIEADTLDTYIVVSRILYEYEKAIGLPEKRLRRNQKNI